MAILKGIQIGVDLGGTNVRAGLVKDGKIAQLSARAIRSQGSKEEVLEDLFQTISAVMHKSVKSIGIGVPSLVNRKTGVILNTTNIPSWEEVPLKRLLEKKFKVPVFLENDANCFALGEKYFGEGKNCENFVGLILGTGLGAGIIANGKLVSGTDGGAGEFGLIPYRDSILEHFASGQYFRKYGRDGAELSAAADRGETEAVRIFGEFGVHVAFAVKTILYALATERIVLGGSVSLAFPHFRPALMDSLSDFAYPSVLNKLTFKTSRLKQSAILGAAALRFEEKK